jgi:hypothetical protein
MTVSRGEADALFRAIEAAFVESGVMEIASQYLGRPVRIVDVTPQINDASDSFWRDIFPDVAHEGIPRTAYCHRDASGGDLKAIIYCTDVGPKGGPFTYAAGSHRFKLSRIEDFVCEVNDSNGLAATDRASRSRFMGLPRALRQKGAFGNDLLDASPASQRLAASLWNITGPKGSVVLFDTKGVHRGGMVTEGERAVITCVIA